MAISAVAFVIFKYWKPISGFFKGMWQGIKEGLQPLMPLFQRLAVAFAPIIKPIQIVINWFKKLIKPVEDTGGAAEKMGVRFGKAIAGIIVKVVELITKIAEFGKKIGDMLANGILSKIGKTKDAIGKHAQIIRDHLPHSPAKTGPLKDLHKIKISETIASAIKPLPIVNAMNNALNMKTTTLKGNVRGGTSGTVINYNPTITMSGSTSSSKEDFTLMLNKHKEEILSLIRKENEIIEGRAKEYGEVIKPRKYTLKDIEEVVDGIDEKGAIHGVETMIRLSSSKYKETFKDAVDFEDD